MYIHYDSLTFKAWILPEDDEGKPIGGDNLGGFGTSQSDAETYM
jgi:hypothetical protein